MMKRSLNYSTLSIAACDLDRAVSVGRIATSGVHGIPRIAIDLRDQADVNDSSRCE
jgi:hypothetical protein